MNLVFILSFLLSLTFKFPEQDKPMKKFHDFEMKTIDGKMIDFSIYKGKKVLVVNVASKCGQTPQYTDLQTLHEKYGDKLVVLGFPANNFLGQEPGTNEEIESFCKKNYGVTFQLFEKISVKGKDQHPLYQWLSQKKMNGTLEDQLPTWNFCKYLINEEGQVVMFYNQKTNPLSDEILSMINK